MRSNLKAWLLATALAGAAQVCMAEAGNGLSIPDAGPAWPHWQARVGINASTPLWRSELGLGGDASGLKVQGLSLIGDYYFARLPLGSQGVGGFRASSGLLLGAGAPLWASQAPGNGSGFALGRRNLGLLATGTGLDPAAMDATTVPYVGLGYSGLTGRGGWGFAADLGVMAVNGGSMVRFGRLFSGTQSVDDLLRELRLTPVLQLGVSYSF